MRRALRRRAVRALLSLKVLWRWTLRRCWSLPLLGLLGPSVVLAWSVLSISGPASTPPAYGQYATAGVPFVDNEGGGLELVCVSTRSGKILPPFLDTTGAL